MLYIARQRRIRRKVEQLKPVGRGYSRPAAGPRFVLDNLIPRLAGVSMHRLRWLFLPGHFRASREE